MEHPPFRHHLGPAGQKPPHLNLQNCISQPPHKYAQQPLTSQKTPHPHPLRQISQIYPSQQPSTHLYILANKIADLSTYAGDGVNPSPR